MPLESIRITSFRGLLHPLKGAPLKKFYIDYGESINGLKEVRDFINNKLAYTTLHEYDYLDRCTVKTTISLPAHTLIYKIDF